MNIAKSDVVFQEVPDEISVAFSGNRMQDWLQWLPFIRMLGEYRNRTY